MSDVPALHSARAAAGGRRHGRVWEKYLRCVGAKQEKAGSWTSSIIAELLPRYSSTLLSLCTLNGTTHLMPPLTRVRYSIRHLSVCGGDTDQRVGACILQPDGFLWPVDAAWFAPFDRDTALDTP